MENVNELRKMKMSIHEKLKNVPLWHSVRRNTDLTIRSINLSNYFECESLRIIFM